ncbi:ArsR family transcriptional regulator [Sorangium cellulosum]|uniref:ArsR family transcriptional regulator n=1 Tax=Sorangium cellulosum TaxID=56 RepID=A0A150PTX4_SORCE|nr:ArsR family transcriptional regulator [Sorangium cellulosum]
MVIEPDSPARALSVEARVGVLKALADASRLQVVSALLGRPHCAEELAERLGRSASTVSFHLRKLDEAGLVTKRKTQYYQVYALRDDLLRLTLRELVALPSASDGPAQRRAERSRNQVLRACFRGGVLVQMPKQWRKRRVVLEQFVGRFQVGRRYREQEVNEIIHALYADHCTIRRMLLDEGYMARDGQRYWLMESGKRTPEAETRTPEAETRMPEAGAREAGVSKVETRKELKRQYLETPKQAGIFQVKNTANGKVLLGSSTNLHGPLNKHRFMLSIGMHMNQELQRDWKQHGADAFTFEVLEVVRQKDEPGFSVSDELTLLEQIWLEKLSPLAPRGYNTDARIRE